MLFSLVENALNDTSNKSLKEAVARYKKNQMIESYTFHDDKVLILFPDLLKCDELPIIYGMEKMELERRKVSSNLMFNITKGDENVSFFKDPESLFLFVSSPDLEKQIMLNKILSLIFS